MKRFTAEEAHERVKASKRRYQDRQRSSRQWQEKENDRKNRHRHAHLNEINERRRAREWRWKELQKERRFEQIRNVFGSGAYVASVVSENEVLRDVSRWTGPGATREKRLERMADAILRAYARHGHQAAQVSK